MIAACIRAIAGELGAADELLVVEADSEEARGCVLGLGDPRVRWLSVPEPGKSRQLNHGIRAAGGEIVLITDDDCVVPAGWMEGMTQPFREEGVGVVFGAVHGLSQLGSAPERLMPGPAPPNAWAFSHGASMGVRRDVAVAIGGFDERLGPGARVHGEEADLMLRAAAAGWRCWLADAPSVGHVEWRDDDEEAANLLVYERGGGAWAGAALRRAPLDARSALATRARYQRNHLTAPEPWRFRLAAELAFARGLLTGLSFPPRRFIPPPTEGAAVRPRRPLDGVPWPALRGRRCLVSGDAGHELGIELRHRGAKVRVLAAAELPRHHGAGYEVVVGWDLLAASVREPAVLSAARRLSAPWFVALEAVDLPLSVLGRGSSLARLAPHAERASWVLNGRAQRTLLEQAGFEVAMASDVWREGPGRYRRAILSRARKPTR